MVHIDGHELAMLATIGGAVQITHGIYGKGWFQSFVHRLAPLLILFASVYEWPYDDDSQKQLVVGMCLNVVVYVVYISSAGLKNLLKPLPTPVLTCDVSHIFSFTLDLPGTQLNSPVPF